MAKVEFNLEITIPRNQFEKIYNANYPDAGKILAEYFFILIDTYGVPKNRIYKILKDMDALLISDKSL